MIPESLETFRPGWEINTVVATIPKIGLPAVLHQMQWGKLDGLNNGWDHKTWCRKSSNINHVILVIWALHAALSRGSAGTGRAWC